MNSFDYRAAHSLAEAVSLLVENRSEAFPIAGGTDLLVRIKQGICSPGLLVDIADVPEFRGIELTENGLRIGSMVTHAEIISSPIIREHIPVLAAAAESIGAPQTRNLGTIGGNLSSCVPSMDCAPPLLALEAKVTIAHTGGTEQMPLEDFFVSPACSIMGPDELLVEILIPKENLRKPSSFIKFGKRKALSLALVNAAACIEINRDKDRFLNVRLALGAVAPTPIRARLAEAFLEGKQASDDIIAEAGVIASGEARPIDDIRASAQYRRELIKVITRRVLRESLSS